MSAVEQIAEGGLDGLPDAMVALINQPMRVERDRQGGTGRYERGDAPWLRQRLQDADHEDLHGALLLRVPQVREGGFYPQSLEKGCVRTAVRPSFPAALPVSLAAKRGPARAMPEHCTRPGRRIFNVPDTRDAERLLERFLTAWEAKSPKLIAWAATADRRDLHVHDASDTSASPAHQ